ncbi:hypothetical protein AB0I95_15190 [Micromonospora sp. NPDC049751]
MILVGTAALLAGYTTDTRILRILGAAILGWGIGCWLVDRGRR